MTELGDIVDTLDGGEPDADLAEIVIAALIDEWHELAAGLLRTPIRWFIRNGAGVGSIAESRLSMATRQVPTPSLLGGTSWQARSLCQGTGASCGARRPPSNIAYMRIICARRPTRSLTPLSYMSKPPPRLKRMGFAVRTT